VTDRQTDGRRDGCEDCDVAGSVPRVRSSDVDGCVSNDETVRLTCEVTYHGSDLMPMTMIWARWIPPTWCKYGYNNSHMLNTLNSSGVHRSAYTFTATGQTARVYDCSVWFSAPTGVVLTDVQRQYGNRPYTRLWSTPLATRIHTGRT